jgi:hypothetical protein
MGPSSASQRMTNPIPKPNKRPLGEAPLKSLRELEFRIGVKREVLLRLASNSGDNYAPFQHTKGAKPHPRIQPVTLPHFLFGAVRERSIRLHAEQHLGAKLIVKMDIKSYYPSITNDHIFHTCGEMFYSAHHASHDYSPSSPHTIDTFRKAYPQAQH